MCVGAGGSGWGVSLSRILLLEMFRQKTFIVTMPTKAMYAPPKGPLVSAVSSACWFYHIIYIINVIEIT